MTKKYFNLGFFIAALTTVSLTSGMLHASERYLYRYTNAEGIKVLNHAIPPEFAQNGYEILSENGQLIKVIQAAPSEGEVSERQYKRELIQKYSLLKRRYSTTEDIENAKTRRLRDLETSIAILQGNIASTHTRIDNLMKDAATREREGRQVSDQLLQQLKDARAELAIAENSLASRQQEHESVAMKYEEDLAVFIEGSKLPVDELSSQELN